MDYQTFISTIADQQSARIKAISIPDSCAPEKIPSVFTSLIPDLIKILENNFNELCGGKPILAIFGLQATSISIESSIPASQQRIFLANQARIHLCCTLSYLPVTAAELTQKNDWSNAQSIIIDFTRGVVMDNQHFIHRLFHKSAPGKVYGELNHSKLNKVWQMLQNVQFMPSYA